MFFIQELRPALNVQSDSIRAKVFKKVFFERSDITNVFNFEAQLNDQEVAYLISHLFLCS